MAGCWPNAGIEAAARSVTITRSAPIAACDRAANFHRIIGLFENEAILGVGVINRQ